MRGKPLHFLSMPVFLALLCLAAVGAGASRSWDAGGDSNDWFDPNNWDPNGDPDAGDILTVLSGTPEATSEVRSSNGGSITLDGALASASFDVLSVGHDGNGTLNIRNGGAVSSSTGLVGYHAGSTGAVMVDGNGSAWVSSGLYVGFGSVSAGGTLVIRNGGAVSNAFVGYLGYFSGSTGTVTVDGTCSRWDSSDSLHVGQYGNGTVDISNGGAVSSAGGTVAYGPQSSGTVTVRDGNSVWHSTGDLYVGGSESGVGGSGSVTVADDGLLDVDGTLKLWAQGTLAIDGGRVTCTSFDNSEGGTFTFTGGTMGVEGGSFAPAPGGCVLDGPDDPELTLTTGASADLGAGSLTVGDADKATLIIEQGATVYNGTGLIAFEATSEASATVRDPNSTWTNTGSLNVGRAGHGELHVLDGGRVESTEGRLGRLQGSIGAAIVSGTGSRWDNSSLLYVGYIGNGTLDITDGAAVSNTTGYVGCGSGSTGTVTVRDSNSIWHNDAGLYVGGSGSAPGGVGSVTVADDGLLDVDGTLKLWTQGTLEIDGGRVTCTSFDNSEGGTFTFTGGTMDIDGGSFAPAPGNCVLDGPDGPELTLTAGASADLGAAGTLRVGDAEKATLIIEQGATVSSATGWIAFGTTSEASVTVRDPNSRWTGPSHTFVGTWGNGTLEISNGGTVSDSSGYVGYASGSTGVVTVDGNGSTWTSAWLYVGDQGNGKLAIRNGGAASVVVEGRVGNVFGSTGVVTVEGNGSTWASDDWLSVGYGGNGTLDISNGGVVSDANGYVGYASGSTGMATVDGGGSRWDSNDLLFVGHDGNGTLDITGGGAVSTLDGVVGYASGSTGVVTVDGNGSTWTSDWLSVGHHGNGTLDITGGGAVSNTVGYVGYASGSTGVVTVDGNGSTWTSDWLSVGEFGNGTLGISGGAVVSNETGYVGYASGSTGVVTVDGSGSTWTCHMEFLDAGIVVGRLGNGTLDISNGGVVSNTVGYVGYGNGSTGMATVDGDGSLWDNRADLYVGCVGDGTLNIAGGGTVSNANGIVGYTSRSTGTVTVSGGGSTWASTGGLQVGTWGNGTLAITGGGAVSSATGNVGKEVGSIGAVTVDGNGSTWMNTGDLYVGGSETAAGGTATVTVSDDGLLGVGGLLKLWPGGTVDLDGGTIRFDDLEDSGGAFNFTSGTVAWTDDLEIAPDGPLGLLGTPLVLGEGKTLQVAGTATVAAGMTFHVTGGGFRSEATVNEGTLTVTDSTVDFGATGLTALGHTVLINAVADGAVHIPAGSAVNVVGAVTFRGEVSGGGDIWGSGTAIFEGGHSPGDSIATVAIEGSAAYGPDCTLTIELTGGGATGVCDEVDIGVETGGDVTLGGTLALDWLPVAGDPASKFGGLYDILTYGGELTGSFTGLGGNIGAAYVKGIVDDADAGGGLLAVRVELADLLAADTDLDGEVGYTDYVAARDGFGSAEADWFGGDLNFDGRTDHLDYLILKQSYGQTVTGAGSEIPEPATLGLLAVGGLAAIRRRSRR